MDHNHPEAERAAAVVRLIKAQDGQNARANAIVMADPKTVEGLRAKALAASAIWQENYTLGSDGEAIMWSIVCDLIDDAAFAGGAAW